MSAQRKTNLNRGTSKVVARSRQRLTRVRAQATQKISKVRSASNAQMPKIASRARSGAASKLARS